jgi:hypothetical protein
MVKSSEAGSCEARVDLLQARNRLLDFISRRLGERGEADAPVVMESVEVAARTYARLSANRGQIINYRDRRKRLTKLALTSQAVAILLEGMDVLSRDHLSVARDDIDIPGLASDLRFLASSCGSLLSNIQRTGKPRDVIEEIWINDVARIYVEFFGVERDRLPSAEFLRFLRLCMPYRFRGGPGKHHGALTPRQIERALSRAGDNPDLSNEIFGKHLEDVLEALEPKK